MSSIKLSSELIESAVKGTVEKILKTSAFEVTLTHGSGKGENFVGDCYRVLCRTFNENADKNKMALQLFLKVAPQHKERRSLFSSRHLFLQEIHLYKILSYFGEFEQSKGIKSLDSFHEYPTCYNTIETEPFESIIFEDLSVDGFVMLNHREECIKSEHMNLIMKALGKFHALSFAVKDQHPDQFKKLAANLGDGTFIRINEKLLNNTASYLYDIADCLTDSQLANRVRGLFSGNVTQNLYDSVRNGSVEPYEVISHADGWNNNVMFKLDENRKPIEVRLLDYQMSRCGPPVLDVLYFIFCCTEKDVRDQHYNEFLEVYHSSLSKHLNRLGTDVNKVYPFRTMLDQMKKCGRYGLYIAALLVPMLTSTPNSGPDLDQLSEMIGESVDITGNFHISAESKGRWQKRMTDIILDMERFGYI